MAPHVEDPYAMAQCSMAMLEPLPPMDVNAISKATEKAFHDQILGGGALPLQVLEAKIDRWIASQKKAA